MERGETNGDSMDSSSETLVEHLGRFKHKMDIWVFPKIGIPQNGWFIMEIPIKMGDLGVPLFSETPICSRGLLYSQGKSLGFIDMSQSHLSTFEGRFMQK